MLEAYVSKFSISLLEEYFVKLLMANTQHTQPAFNDQKYSNVKPFPYLRLIVSKEREANMQGV